MEFHIHSVRFQGVVEMRGKFDKIFANDFSILKGPPKVLVKPNGPQGLVNVPCRDEIVVHGQR